MSRDFNETVLGNYEVYIKPKKNPLQRERFRLRRKQKNGESEMGHFLMNKPI